MVRMTTSGSETLKGDDTDALAPNITIGPRIESSTSALGGEKPNFGEVFDDLG